MRRIDYGLPVFEGSDKVKMNEYTEELAYALKGQIDRFGNPLTFRGVVSTINDLPEEAVAGDIYNVTEINKNYVYSGAEWLEYSDAMGNAATQEYVNERGVAVDSTQPTTTEKVWIKKGKNMLDMSSIFGLGTLNNNTGLFVKISGVTLISSSSSSVVYKTETEWAGIVYSVSVLPSTQYTLKFSTDYHGHDYTIIEGYQKNGTRTRRIIDSGDETITFTTNANEYEIKICIETGSLTNTNITISNLQLEQGSSATTFEPYVEKEILVKNDNGIFEKFYSEYQDNYSTSERRIGTWIDGKPLYRKVISYKPSQTIGAIGQLTDIDIAHNVSNLKMGWVSNAFTSDGYQIPAFTGSSNVEKGTNVYRVTENYIQYKLINDTWGATRTWYFVLEYTKTTD